MAGLIAANCSSRGRLFRPGWIVSGMITAGVNEKAGGATDRSDGVYQNSGVRESLASQMLKKLDRLWICDAKTDRLLVRIHLERILCA
jgi:hypothetical protein